MLKAKIEGAMGLLIPRLLSFTVFGAGTIAPRRVSRGRTRTKRLTRCQFSELGSSYMLEGTC